jgi:hypothetical protein
LVVYQKNYKRDVTDIWNQENINLIMFMMRTHKYISMKVKDRHVISINVTRKCMLPDWLRYLTRLAEIMNQIGWRIEPHWMKYWARLAEILNQIGSNIEPSSLFQPIWYNISANLVQLLQNLAEIYFHSNKMCWQYIKNHWLHCSLSDSHSIEKRKTFS